MAKVWKWRKAGRSLILSQGAQACRAEIAEQLLPALNVTPPDAIARAVERCPSLRRYPVGRASLKVRTALRSGDISSWDLPR